MIILVIRRILVMLVMMETMMMFGFWGFAQLEENCSRIINIAISMLIIMVVLVRMMMMPSTKTHW